MWGQMLILMLPTQMTMDEVFPIATTQVAKVDVGSIVTKRNVTMNDGEATVVTQPTNIKAILNADVKVIVNTNVGNTDVEATGNANVKAVALIFKWYLVSFLPLKLS